MSDLKIQLTAEIDPSSISNMTKQLKGIQEGVGKIKIDIDTNEVMSRLTQLESKMKPMDLKIDTSNVKSKLVDINGDMQKFYTTSVKSMSSANGATQKYVTTMLNADRTLKQVTTTTKDMEGNVLNVGTAITKSFSHPIRDAQVEALKLNKNFDKIGQGLKGDLSAKLQTLAKDFRDVAPAHVTADIDRMIKSLDFSSSTFDADVKNIERAIKNLGTESKLTADELNKALSFENKTGKLSSDLQKLARDFEGVVSPQDIAEIEQMIASLNPNSITLPQELTKIRDRMTEVGQESSHAKKEIDSMAQSTGGLGKMMGSMLKRAVGWVSLTMVIRKTFREIQKGVAIVKEVDSAMVELKRVTNATEQEYADFMNASFELGKQLGKSGTDVINATADFSRMGFDMKEASDLAQEALLMTNVGDGVDNVEQASTAIITALKGFKVESEDSVEAARHINDAYNEVANNFAIDTENIAEGVRRSSALMAASGNDINQTIGLVTGGFEVMQDSSKVSSGLNIIAQRLKGINDEGKNSPELVAKLKNEFKDIANIDLELPNGELKNTYTILEELAEVYPDLSSKQRAYLAELAAGKRQSVVLESIMSNWENVAKATQTATDAAGSAMEENEKYMDSIEGKLGILEAAKEQFWSTLIDTNAVKKVVDVGIGFVDGLSEIVRMFQEITDGATDATKAAESLPETLSKHKDDLNFLEGVESEFEYLQSLVGDNGELARMSAEQQERYLEIVRKLKESQPDLEGFYNSQGEFVLKTKSAIDELIKSKEKEMELDREKAAGGLGDRVDKHKDEIKSLQDEKKLLEDDMKENKRQIDYYEGLKTDQGGYLGEIDTATLEAQKKNYKQSQKDLDEHTKKTAESIQKTMEVVSPAIQVLGTDIESLNPQVENITSGIQNMLEIDSSNVDNIEGIRDVLKNAYGDIQEALDTGGLLPDKDSIIDSISQLTDLGMGYEDVADGLFRTMSVAKNGEGGINAIDTAIKEFNETGEITGKTLGVLQGEFEHVADGTKEVSVEMLKQIADTDEYAAAIMGMSHDVGTSVEGLVKDIKSSTEKLDISDVVKPDGVIKAFGEIDKASKNNVQQIEADANKQSEIYEYLYKELGFLTETQYNELMQGHKQQTEDRINNEKKVTDDLRNQVLDRGQVVREDLKNSQKAFENTDRDIKSIFGDMDETTKEFLIEVLGVEDLENNLELVEDFLKGEDIKEIVVQGVGFDIIRENMDELGESWNNLDSEEQVFVATMVGNALEDPQILMDEWEGMSPKEQDFIANAIVNNIDETVDFVAVWEALDPVIQKFIAESAGIDDVENATADVMAEWIKDPKVKMFMAMQEGLDTVRIERGKTDDEWNITIGDVTYTTNEEGAEAARKAFGLTQEQWDKIANHSVKVKETKHIQTGTWSATSEAGYSTVGRWTGDDNFKGGLSFVGEKGRELLIYPDGSHDMTGDKAELRNLPRGTIIYNNQDTEDILLGRKKPEFNRDDKRLKGGSNTPGFAKGNTEAKNVKGSNTPGFASGNAKAEDRAIADIYERVNRQLEKQGNLIKRNNLLQERAEGNLARQIVLLKEQLQLNKDEEKMLKAKQALQRKERNDLERHLSKAGFKFKGKGDDRQISNLGNISGKNKSVEEKFNQFNDLSFNLIPSLNADILSIQNDIANSVSKGFEKQTRLNNEVLKNNHLLSMNAIYRERAVGDTKETIKLINEEIKLQTKKESLLKDQSDIHRAERAELEKVLKKEGFKFEGKGDFQFVTNENHVKGKLKEVQDALDKYNEIQLEIIPTISIDREQIEISNDKKRSEAIDVQFSADDEEIAEFDRRTARSLENNKIVQRKNDPHWDIVSNQGALEVMEEKRSFQYNKGWEYINKAEKLDPAKDREDIKKLNDKAQEYFKDSRDAQLEIFELKTKVHEGQMRYIDEELKANTKSQDELKFQLELLDDDDLVGKLDLTSKIAAKEIESYTTIKSNVKALEDQLKVTSYNTDEWHVINDSLEKYNQLLKDSTLELKKQKDELVKIASSQADRQFDSNLESAERNIFGGQTEKDAKKVLDDKIEAFEDYISGEEKALEIAQIRKMVEEESLSLTQEQHRILNEGGSVERAKLDRLNKQLNIQQLQAKLENQKNQKNIRQLVKKDDGTFDFEYVADKKAIKETENALLESKKDLANWELKNSLDKDKKIFEEKQKLLAVEEERLQEKLKAEKEAIEAHYQAIMERQIAMMEMNMALMEQLNSEKSIKGWSETIEGIMPLMDELGINFAELMEELGVDLEDNFDVIFPLLYDMGLLHEDMVEGMGIDFEKYIDAAIPVLDELGIDHEKFLKFMGVDLDKFLKNAEMTFEQYSKAVKKKNAETKADVEKTKAALKVPTESMHTVKIDAYEANRTIFELKKDTSSTHTVYTKTVGGFESGGRYKPESFDTGGYTGNFSGGKLAVLHEKEIVLNKSQSATFEKLIDIMPNMVNTFNDIAGKFKGIAPKIPKVPVATNNISSKDTVQNFNISKLEFPNVKDAGEIESSIRGLSTFATQWANKV